MVSVIVPNFNHASFLEKRINSILKQTYQDFEIIILDDCSTDNSKEIILQYQNHPKVTHTVFNELNSGSPFIQWKKGFDLGTGQFIWIAESDDYSDIHFLETMMSLFHKSNCVGIAYCDSNVVDENGSIKKEFYKGYKNQIFNTEKWTHDYLKTGVDEISENLIFDCTINNTSSMIFKKDLLDRVDLKKLIEFKYSGDWFFFLSISLHTDLAYSSRAMNYFKVGTNNFKNNVRSSLNHFKERTLVRYQIWETIEKELPLDKREKIYKQLGTELKIQLNEVIKGKVSLQDLWVVLKLFKKTNSFLFKKQFLHAIKGYV